MNTLKVSHIVIGTSTNSQGFILFTELDKYLCKNEIVIIDIENIDYFSSSFLNSSFGELIAKHGKEKVKKTLRFTNYKQSVLDIIVKYINELNLVY